MDDRLDLYTSIVPNPRQLVVQDMKFYAFVHYTVNTFTGKEWGNGKEAPTVFAPRAQDTDQWCEAIAAARMKGVILTAKHHDGFCLWQTATTEHSIKNSGYRGGKGDVVAELAASCKKYGLKLGIYLSPWDRNSEYYGTDKYNDFYIAQMTELLDGRYGDIFMLWLDGACGAAADGKPAQEYDFPRIWSTAMSLQPNICISGCGPDIRWVGNESGKSRESEWNVVPSFQCEAQNIAAESQNTDDMKAFQKRCVDVLSKDLGSREFLADFNNLVWYPAEVDVSIRTGWFHHGIFDITTKSLRHLMKIYYRAVGGNSLLLLNIPPDKNGRFSPRDVRRLRSIGREIDKQNALRHCHLDSPQYTEKDGTFTYTLDFERTSVDRVIMEEDTTHSQRVERFEIQVREGDVYRTVYSGTVIGYGAICIFEPTVTDSIRVVITACRLEPYMRFAEVYRTGAYRI